jgi:hypothetical protein
MNPASLSFAVKRKQFMLKSRRPSQQIIVFLVPLLPVLPAVFVFEFSISFRPHPRAVGRRTAASATATATAVTVTATATSATISCP